MAKTSDNLEKNNQEQSDSPLSRGSGIQHDDPTRRYWQCTACSQLAEYSDDRTSCSACGGRLVAIYSGQRAELVTGYDKFEAPPPVEFVERRRFPRIRCKNVKACVKPEQGVQVVVDMVNMSRGGVCFTTREKFSVGAAVSIATHYIEGGFNIFQNARIVRFRLPESSPETSPTEYAIEFSTDQRPA